MVPKLCHPKVQNVIKWINSKRLSKNYEVIPENYEVIVMECFTCYCFANDPIKLEELKTNFLKCLKMASKNFSYCIRECLPPCLHILAINYQPLIVT